MKCFIVMKRSMLRHGRDPSWISCVWHWISFLCWFRTCFVSWGQFTIGEQWDFTQRSKLLISHLFCQRFLECSCSFHNCLGQSSVFYIYFLEYRDKFLRFSHLISMEVWKSRHECQLYCSSKHMLIFALVKTSMIYIKYSIHCWIVFYRDHLSGVVCWWLDPTDSWWILFGTDCRIENRIGPILDL